MNTTVFLYISRLIPLIVTGDDFQGLQQNGNMANNSIIMTTPVYSLKEINQFTNTKRTLSDLNSNLNSKRNREITNSLAVPPVNTLTSDFITQSPIHTITNDHALNTSTKHAKIKDRYTKNHNTLNNLNTNLKSQIFTKYEKEDMPKKVSGAEITFNFFINNARKIIKYNTTVQAQNASVYEMTNTKNVTALRNFTYTKTREENPKKLYKNVADFEGDIYKNEFGKAKNSTIISNNSERSNNTRKFRAKNNLIDGIRNYLNYMFTNITLNGTNKGQQNKTLYNTTRIKDRLNVLSILMRLGNIESPLKLPSTAVRRLYENIDLVKGNLLRYDMGSDALEKLSKLYLPKLSSLEKLLENETFPLPPEYDPKNESTPYIGTNTATNWNCRVDCPKFYYDYGPVCAARLNTRYTVWQYRYKSFSSYCELLLANCMYPYHKPAWWILHQKACDFSMMPSEPTGEVGISGRTMYEDWTARPTLPVLWPDALASRAADYANFTNDGTRWLVDEQSPYFSGNY
ncbi:uncharacterized protein LOC113228356 [Hyposmocoma kahamanoa]|uniref:uncharacterized protein LOC113228356 n=1 Tax=Hyposmocoma kahamanoa TaxID=1477025 RepID=UPI000E6D7003|nr:uncharacterized protein LOC113228356 [Hyposmocoma kahamanoa]